MENLTGGTPPVRYLPCVVPCKLYFGAVETIDDKKKSVDLRNALNNGIRIIVTTLQKFPVIYTEVDKSEKKNYAIIVDEAHSSQTGSSALKLKTALADTEEALREYAEIEGVAEDEVDKNDKVVQEMITHGKHKNLSFLHSQLHQRDKRLKCLVRQFLMEKMDSIHFISIA